jgi:hypothetical protein
MLGSERQRPARCSRLEHVALNLQRREFRQLLGEQRSEWAKQLLTQRKVAIGGLTHALGCSERVCSRLSALDGADFEQLMPPLLAAAAGAGQHRALHRVCRSRRVAVLGHLTSDFPR